jgi:hypothetical protein
VLYRENIQISYNAKFIGLIRNIDQVAYFTLVQYNMMEKIYSSFGDGQNCNMQFLRNIGGNGLIVS